MRFFNRREPEPKEASELPVYREEEPIYFSPQGVSNPLRGLHDAQWHFYTSRGVSAFEIKEWEVIEALVVADYICDPVIEGKEHGTEDWYYTNIPLEHDASITLSGVEIERRGMSILTILAQHRRDLEESDKQWRQERRDYYRQRRRRNS